MSSLEKGRNTRSKTALMQQLAFQILQHDVQCGDATLGGIPDSRVGQIDQMAVLVGVSAHNQLIFHDVLRQLGTVGANGSIAVHHKDVVRVFVNDKLEGSLIAVGGGVDVGIHADIFKADRKSTRLNSSHVSIS